MRLFAETVSGTVEAWQNDEAELRDCTSSQGTPDPMHVRALARLDECTMQRDCLPSHPIASITLSGPRFYSQQPCTHTSRMYCRQEELGKRINQHGENINNLAPTPKELYKSKIGEGVASTQGVGGCAIGSHTSVDLSTFLILVSDSSSNRCLCG